MVVKVGEIIVSWFDKMILFRHNLIFWGEKVTGAVFPIFPIFLEWSNIARVGMSCN